MHKAIVIPDSFKGTLSSSEVCRIMEAAIHAHYPQCQVIPLPIADGGEGSVDCFLSKGGEKVCLEVTGPFFQPVESFYGLIDDGQTAVIELAACAGLPLVEGREDPSRTTTFGVGEMMLDAAARNCRRIILCLGGSCTNDGGAGAAAACGIIFRDARGQNFVPVGGTLKDVAHIDPSALSPALSGIEIVTMCDIDSPLYGPSGAAHVFAPQKGADEAMVKRLDEGLRHLAAIIAADLRCPVDDLPGGGAAGGMGAGSFAFFGATLRMGIEVVLEQFRFGDLLEDCSLVFTGEGRIDSQSLRGKVVIGVARQARRRGVPVVAVVGQILDPIDGVYGQGVTAVFPILRQAGPFEDIRRDSPGNLALTMDSILRLYRSGQNRS